MAELKTKATDKNPQEFLKAIKPEQKKLDGLVLLELFTKATKEKPVLWGSSIVGFGQYHYKSERSTQEGDWPLVGFSPHKQNITLYIMNESIKDSALLKKLGKHKTSVGCLYINKLSDVDQTVLLSLIEQSYQAMKTYHS